MKLAKRQTWDFDFECNDYTDYTMILTFEADSKLFNFLFDKSQEQLKKKKGIKVEGNLNVIEQFEVPDQYMPFINNFIKKPINITERDHLRPDGIELRSNKIHKAIFKNKGKIWDIIITIKGQYIKK